MATIYVIRRDGSEHVLEESPSGQPLMEILRDNDMDVEAICGGCCSCATCHVYVDVAWTDKLRPREEDELELVSSTDHYRENSRLSCQIPFKDELDGIKLIVAPEE